jgi:hypothetical protein
VLSAETIHIIMTDSDYSYMKRYNMKYEYNRWISFFKIFIPKTNLQRFILYDDYNSTVQRALRNEAKKLAKNGFFFTGWDTQIHCAFCDYGTIYLPGDNIVKNHKKWSPNCNFQGVNVPMLKIK